MAAQGSRLALELAVALIEQAGPILRDVLVDPQKYDRMTAEEIRARLRPASREELEARANG